MIDGPSDYVKKQLQWEWNNLSEGKESAGIEVKQCKVLELG